jgi:hypothetical protein
MSKVNLIAIFITILFSMCCKKKPVQLQLAPGVHVAGTVTSNGKLHAAYWYAKQIHMVGDSNAQSNAYCIAHSGNNLYIGGATLDAMGKEHAAYWRNDTLMAVPENFGSSSVQDIAAIGTDVYLFGYDGIGSSAGAYLCYWKNGVQTLLNTAGNCTAGKMHVINNTVYTCGSEISGGVQYGAVWEGNTQKMYTANCGVTDVKYANGKIYAAGYTINGSNTTAAYWEGTLASANLLPCATAFGRATCLDVDGSDIHIGGTDRYPTATNSVIWKNAVPSIVTTTQYYGEINTLKVSGTNVHACGTISNAGFAAAAYWNNGYLESLDPNRVYTNCRAYDLDVVQ